MSERTPQDVLRAEPVDTIWGFALWTEFAWGQPDTDSTRGPRPLPPDDPYWIAAAGRVRELIDKATKPLDKAIAEAPDSPLYWWCPAWGTLNQTRYHGNEGPDDPNCGKVAYRQVIGPGVAAPDTLSEKPGLDVAERIANFLPVPPQVSGNENRELGWAMARTQLIAAIRARPRLGSTDSEGR